MTWVMFGAVHRYAYTHLSFVSAPVYSLAVYDVQIYQELIAFWRRDGCRHYLLMPIFEEIS